MKEKKEIKYFIYARRSIEKGDREENVASIDSQLREVKELAKKLNLKVVGTFKETKSAKKPYLREQFIEMIEKIKEGKADGILCWKMDRLTRNPIDEGTIKYLLQEEIIKNIKSVDRDFYPDDNVLLSAVEFGVATQYSRDLIKHIKRGQRNSVSRGYRPSLAPVGYLNSKYKDKNREEEILIDDDRIDKVRKLFDLMLTGQYSIMNLLEKSNKEIGLTVRGYGSRPDRKISRSAIYNIFTNTFYYGKFEYPKGSGNWYDGNHKPLISKEEYDTIQCILGKKGKPRPRTHKFAYTGIMRCAGCGSMITAQKKWKYQKNGNVHSYIYYHCTGKSHNKCPEKAVREEILEKEFVFFLDSIRIPKEFHEWAIETLKEVNEKEKKNRTSVVKKLQKEYKLVIDKIEKLLDLRISNEITSEEYSEKKKRLEEEKETVMFQTEQVDKKIDEWIRLAEETLDFVRYAKYAFIKGDLETKKKIISNVCYNLSIKDQVVNIQAEEPIALIQKMKKETDLISNMLEPTKSVDTKRLLKYSYDKNLLLWT
ncbi:recombinase family protein [Patescibacteria group bacterium]|nr:recombinase family protein [Patescibacteria group bacterium]